MNMTPTEIVAKLDQYIIGQDAAKKAVAISLRNRWRRQQIKEELRQEIMPNNIILIGPTGVGKTELARRLARLADAPFIKVEASKFTEVGYVGRDVEAIIRDLVDLGVAMVRTEHMMRVDELAESLALERLLDLLLPPSKSKSDEDDQASKAIEKQNRTREKLRQRVLDGKMDERLVELDVQAGYTPLMQVISPIGVEEMGVNIQEMLGSMLPEKKKKRRMTVREAFGYLHQEEIQKLIDMDEVVREAIERVENSGIVFLDEIDKIASGESGGGIDVSREGVQRDLLPVIEGTNVVTKYGMVATDHILFIASGAFHVSKPSDLIPELQGRFPIRVELNSLTADDFVRILVEPQNALIKQYTALMAAENARLILTKGAIREIARIASEVNERTENIGARRLQTVLSLLLEDYLYRLPDETIKEIKIDKKQVTEKLKDIVSDEDLSQYIL